MNVAPLIDLLLTAGLLAIPITPLVWLARQSDPPARSPFGMRFDPSSPPVAEEGDPPRWRIGRIGEGTVTSGRSTQVRVERPAFSGAQPTLRPSSERPHAGMTHPTLADPT